MRRFLLCLALPWHACASLHEGDIKFDPDVYERLYHAKPRRLGSVREEHPAINLWHENRENGSYVVPYTLRDAFDETENATNSLTESEAQHIEDEINDMADDLGNVIRFERLDNVSVTERPVSYLRIGEFGGGCWSYVGRNEPEHQPQVVNLGTSCLFSSTVQHELMHALGFLHEQARADRDSYVMVNWDNIDESAQENFEKLSEFIDSRDSPYDYASIMHYGPHAFAKNRSEPTLIANATIGESSAMTAMDVIQLRMLYRCDAPRDSYNTNCEAACPCSHGEGLCVGDSGCNGNLTCINQVCQEPGGNVTLPPSVPTPIFVDLGLLNPMLVALPVLMSGALATWIIL